MRTVLRDPWLLGILGLGVCLYAAWTVFVVLTDRPLDYYVYLIAADTLGQGENIYQAGPDTYRAAARRLGISTDTPDYLYPPLTALVVWPLGLLPLRAGAALWVAGSGMAALGAALLLAAPAPLNWQRRAIVLATVGFVPVLTTMHAGQVNAFVLLATAAALTALRQQREMQGGAWLAVALWLKPLVAALVTLLLWRGYWRALAGMVVASIVIALASAAAFGLEPVLTQNSGRVALAALEPIADPAPPIQNLRALLGRWLTPHAYGAPLWQAPGLALPLYLACIALTGGVLFWLLWPAGPRSPAQLELEAALLITTTHLLAPLTWYHHLTLLLVALAVLVRCWPDWRRHWWELLLLAGVVLALAVHGLLWKQLVGHTLLLDLGTWASLLLCLLLARQVCQARQKKQTGENWTMDGSG